MDESGSFREGTEGDIVELGRRLGEVFVEGWQRAVPVCVSSLNSALHSLELPFGTLPTSAELEQERRLHLRLAEQVGGLALAAEPWEARHMDQRSMHGAVAAWAGQMLALAAEGGLPRSVRGEIQALSFGQDLVLLGFPGELFSEIGMRVKKDSPFRHTVVCGYAGGTVGYVPTRTALAEGGYEVDAAYKLYRLPAAFRQDIEQIVCREVGALLAHLYEGSDSPGPR
jgi:hypothetical protein